MIKRVLLICIIYMLSITLFYCKKDTVSSQEDLTVTDIDGNIYQTVTIGDQIWMAENLKVTHYSTGDAIPNVTDNIEWSNLSTGALSEYNNDTINVATYGRLYNWYAVDDSRNIAPTGWHVPTDDEWKELERYLGMGIEVGASGFRGTNEGSKLADNADLWMDGILDNNAEFGTSGFTALPSGFRSPRTGKFLSVGGDCYFWSASETTSESNYAWYRSLYDWHSDINRGAGFSMGGGFSVRCVKD